MIDLHQHSTFSDGTDDVETLIRKNKDKGILIMSITDHDNINSAKYIKSLKNKYGIGYINGIEFSTDYDGNSVHILAYGYDTRDPIINDLVLVSRELRIERVQTRIRLLKEEFNIELGEENLKKINESKNPNKPMLGNMLIEMGYGDNLTQVIKKYLYHKLPSSKLSIEILLQKLKQSSAKSVYAHPLGGVGEKRVDRSTFEERLKYFKSLGLDGIECYYSLYNQEEQAYLVENAKKYNLFISGGSDYHGTNKTVQIGEVSNFGLIPQEKQFTILSEVQKIEL